MAKKEFITNRIKKPEEEGVVVPITIEENNTSMDKLTTMEISIDKIDYNPFQSRFKIDEISIQSLKDSIKENGLINPITVSKKDKRYCIVAGHRRFEALKSLGYETIQVILKDLDDKELISSNIIENSERKNISIIETALAYLDLSKLVSNNRELATYLAVSESKVSSYLLMATKLDESIIESLKENPDFKHVNFLTKLSSLDKDTQKEIFEKVKNKKLKIDTAILNMNKILKEQKQGKTYFNKSIKTNRNKAVITINENKLLIKGNLVAINKDKKEQLIIELEQLLEKFYQDNEKQLNNKDYSLKYRIAKNIKEKDIDCDGARGLTWDEYNIDKAYNTYKKVHPECIIVKVSKDKKEDKKITK